MARTYYQSSNTGTLGTTTTANGINVSFTPTENTSYAIFHSGQLAFSTAPQTATLKIIVTDTVESINNVPWTPANLPAGNPAYIFDSRVATSGTGSVVNSGAAGGTWTHDGSGTTLTTRNGVSVLTFNGSGRFPLYTQSAYAGPLTILTLTEITADATGDYCILNLGNWSLNNDEECVIVYEKAYYFESGTNDVQNYEDVTFWRGYDHGLGVHSRTTANNNTINDDGNLDFKVVIGAVSGHRARLNGANTTLAASTVTGPNEPQYPDGGVYIGRNESNTEGYVGDIALIVVCKEKLSNEDIQRLEGYYAHSFSLTARLPSDHPYKNSPPMISGTGTGPQGDLFEWPNDGEGQAVANVREMFSGGTMNATLWAVAGNGSASNVWVSNDRLYIRSRGTGLGIAGPDGIGLYSKRKYNLKSSAVTFQLYSANNVPTATGHNLYVGVYSEGGSSNSINSAYLAIYNTDGSNLDIEGKQGHSFQAGYTSYNPAVHKWGRIRESNGTLYWDTSTDGNTWTNLASTTGINVNTQAVKVFTTSRNWNETNTADQWVQVDNINHMSGIILNGGVGNVNANGLPITYLQESFNGGANSILWVKINEGTNPDLAYANGKLELLARNNSNYPRLVSKNRYNLMSNSVFVLVPSIGTPVAAQEVEFRLNSDSDANATSNSLKWQIATQYGNNRIQVYTNGAISHSNTSTTLGVYGTTRWYRIGESAGVITWSTSSDGSTWTTANTITMASRPNINIKNVRIELTASLNAGDGTNRVEFDNLNLISSNSVREITYYETNMESEASTDKFWSGGLEVYTAPIPVLTPTNVRIHVSTSTGTLSVRDQYLTVLKLGANDIFASTNHNNTLATVGTSGNGISAYNSVKEITIPPGDYTIIASAVISDNKATPAATNNIRMAVLDATENVAFGYVDSTNKATASDNVPYWYVGTHNTDNTRTYKLIYDSPSGSMANVRNANLLALAQSDFAETISKHDETWSSVTSGSFTSAFAYPVTPTFSGDYLVLSSWYMAYGGTDSTYSKLKLGASSLYQSDFVQNPTHTISTNGPGGSKFAHGFAGVNVVSQISQTFDIQVQSGTSGQASLIGRKNITAISLGDKDVATDLYVKTGDTWYQTIPYVKDGGTWKAFVPSVKAGGSWSSVANTPISYESTVTQNTSFLWSAVQSTPATVSYRSAAYGKDTYVLAGHGGMINTSTDAVTWTSRTSGTTVSIYALMYSNKDNYFVAGNVGGYTSTSLDGITWGTWRSSDVSGNTIYDIICENNLYVLCAGYSRISTSTDGVTWTSRKSGISVTFNGLTYAEGLYVCVGTSGHLNTSTDGITWTARTSGTSSEIRGVGYGNGTFVYVGAGGVIGTSTDAITWTTNTSVTTTVLHKVRYGNGLYVTTGDAGVSFYSTDAVYWQPADTGQVLYNLSAVTYIHGRGEFLAAGVGGKTHISVTNKGSPDFASKFL
jgi:hypothetical protein